MAAPVVLAGPAGASSSSLCKQMTSAKVAMSLGLKGTKETPTTNGDVTLCWYEVGSNPHAVFIRARANDSAAGYNSDLKGAKKQHENPKPDLNFKPHSAFSTSIGSTTYGYTYSVTVLKQRVELSVGAANATLAKVETLAKLVLPQV